MARLDIHIALAAAYQHAKELVPFNSYADKQAAALAIMEHLEAYDFHTSVAEDAANAAVNLWVGYS